MTESPIDTVGQKETNRKVGLAHLQCVAQLAAIRRDGNTGSHAEIAKQLGVNEKTFSSYITRMEAHYGVPLSEVSDAGEKKSQLSSLGKVVGNHAIQFWVLDRLLTTVLDSRSFDNNVAAMGEEFFTDLFEHLERGAALALEFQQRAGNLLGDPSHYSDDEIFTRGADGTSVSLADFKKSAEPCGYCILDHPEPPAPGAPTVELSRVRDARMARWQETNNEANAEAGANGNTDAESEEETG